MVRAWTRPSRASPYWQPMRRACRTQKAYGMTLPGQFARSVHSMFPRFPWRSPFCRNVAWPSDCRIHGRCETLQVPYESRIEGPCVKGCDSVQMDARGKLSNSPEMQLLLNIIANIQHLTKAALGHRLSEAASSPRSCTWLLRKEAAKRLDTRGTLALSGKRKESPRGSFPSRAP